MRGRHAPQRPWALVQRRVRRLAPAPVRRADLALFRAIADADLPLADQVLPRLSRAADRSRLWVALAAVLAVVGGRTGRRAGLRGLVAIGVTSALTNLPAKLLVGRDRPELALVPEARRLARVPASTSFPSGHSASAFAFATGASLEAPALRVPLFGLATAVAGSRVTTGVHYPGDVLAGAAIGVVVARATLRRWGLPDDRAATGRDLGPSPLVDGDGDGLVVVANAGAGNALGSGPEAQLRDGLPAATILEAEAGEDLPHLLSRVAPEARVLGIAGGDGSAGLAAAHAAGTGRPLLVVAGGTLNHLANDLGLGRTEASIDAARSGRVVAADLGTVGERTFVNAASIGLYPALVARRERLERWIGKWPAALVALLVELRRGEPLTVDVDGRARRIWFLFVGNGRFVDDGLAPSRRHRLDEGVVDVRLVSAEPWLARTRMAVSILAGRAGRSASYERWLADQVHVRSHDGPLRVATDGEVAEGPSEVTFAKRTGALRLLQPASPERG